MTIRAVENQKTKGRGNRDGLREKLEGDCMEKGGDSRRKQAALSGSHHMPPALPEFADLNTATFPTAFARILSCSFAMLPAKAGLLSS